MTEQLGLDLGVELPDVEPEQLSAGQRLTIRQHRDIEAGVHPLTREPTRPELGTCGECLHRVMRSKAYAKCDRPGGAPVTRSAATDVRAFWPACPKFTPRPEDTR